MTNARWKPFRVAAFSTAIALMWLAVAVKTATPATAASPARPMGAVALPDRLSDAEFWKLASDISEPGGYFRITDNFTSNEPEVGEVFALLRERGVEGGVYIGVGPEQNFSYIAAVRPAMAFVIDIRRQAVIQHLLYKAVFELAADRADFISLLFSKPRPAGLDSTTPIQKIWDAYAPVATSLESASRNRTRILDRLLTTHRFTFTDDEREQFDEVFQAFINYGPGISTRGSAGGNRGAGNTTTFVDLTGWALDPKGQPQSFLSTEEHFRTVKTLHEKNLIVPVSGDFGGPKALRAIGAYVRAQRGTVSAYYLSNVEQYLFQDGKQREFYDNVATLPTTPESVFIRPYSLRRGTPVPRPLCPIGRFVRSFAEGRVFSNAQALACSE